MSDLRIDWATSKAASYACRKWHYSGTMPPSSSVKIGVWEDDIFTGVILFSLGCGDCTNGKAYGLPDKFAIAELARVALKPGHKTPVSRCVAIAIRMLRRQSPNLKMLISFADPDQGHHGGIYQAMNWIYTGLSDRNKYFIVRGKRIHGRTVGGRGWVQSVGWLRDNIDPDADLVLLPKHRYLLPLDDETRQRILPLAKPYPKRGKDQAPAFPAGLGGETPTPTLRLSEAA